MGKFKIALDDLLEHCHEGLELYANGEIKLFFDAPEYLEKGVEFRLHPAGYAVTS